MAGFTLNEWIEETPQKVFEALSRPESAPLIMPNIRSMESLTPGPVGVGTRFREQRLVDGKLQETELEVVEYQAPVRYGVSAEQSGITVTYRYSLSKSGRGTQVDLECTVEGRGARKLMLPLVAGVMKKEDGDHLVHLKTALEKQKA